ncbi:MAG TPA: hypothetical protein VFU93_02665 [Acidimicrobiales bacterium]|nr:hypothetical protein [Acidimicrobiales bacterium]
MTDVLDRLDEPVTDTVVADDVDRGNDRPARTALAAVSAAAALIHVAMGPGHLAEDAIVGGGMIGATWLQLAVAWFALARPGRRVWLGTIALNVALIGTWAVSRTSGLPFGAHEGEAESMTIVDLTTVALEVATLLLAARLLLLRPSGSRLAARAMTFGIPVLAVVAASAALASPDARSHGGTAHDDGHAAATPALAALQERGFGTFMNGHAHDIVQTTLDPVTQAELDRQLDITRELAAEFPTLQDAVDAGYRRAGPYVPGLGVHMIKFDGEGYLNPDGVMDDVDLRHPLSLLYLGTDADAELGGFMYYAATTEEPAGFPGRNDGWHYHENLCAVPAADGFLDFPFGPDFGATQAQCDTVGGNLMDSNWMIHVWTVPGWDDMEDYGGVFAEMHPGFACSDGTWFSKPFEEWKDNRLNTCQSGAVGAYSVAS